MEIKFGGAARMVTGSAHLVTLDDGYKILLDCGMVQGKGDQNYELNSKWEFDVKEIDCMILSHAHIDHSGRIPKLVKDGFTGPIHSTHATRSLCSIMLLDSAKIQESDAEWFNQKLRKKRKKKSQDFRVALYGPTDVQPALDKFVSHSYENWFTIKPGLEVLFRDQGHILGSASVTLRIKQGKKTTMFGFTGDIGRPDRPILRDPIPMPELDYLICESTYGDKEHESPPEQSQAFLRIVREACVEKKGKLIIPAFSIGRTQELVYMMDKLETAGLLPKIPVYVDSPLAVNATHIYGTHRECYDDNLHQYMLEDPDPFGFNSLKYIKSVDQSKQLNNNKKPAIIVSSSGMMNAGRIRHHLYNNMEDPKNTFLIVGYCSPDTAGGMLKAGVKELKIFGEIKKVNAAIETMDSFSAHADRKEMVEFLSNQKKLKKIYLVHGEYRPQQAFKKYLEKAGLGEVIIPELGDTFSVTKGKLKVSSKPKKKKAKVQAKSGKVYPAKSKNRIANLEKEKKKSKGNSKTKTGKKSAKAKVALGKVKIKPTTKSKSALKASAKLKEAIKKKKEKAEAKAAQNKFSKKKRVSDLDSSNHWKKKK